MIASGQEGFYRTASQQDITDVVLTRERINSAWSHSATPPPPSSACVFLLSHTSAVQSVLSHVPNNFCSVLSPS